MMYDLIINEELKNLLPPLTAEEYAGLEESILKDGCLSALVTWNKMLVEGHHRYEICKKHGLAFEVKSIEFESIDEAKLWILKHQTNRRNLTPYHRGELALKFKETIAAKAKERQGKRSDLNTSNIPENFPECRETREELAEIAGMSSRSLDKIEYIVENADEETKEKLRQGVKKTSIDREYNRIREEKKRGQTQSIGSNKKHGQTKEEVPDTVPPNESDSSSKEVPEENVDIQQFLQKYYFPSRVDDLLDDASNAFPEMACHLPYISFLKAKERLNSGENPDAYVFNYICSFFEFLPSKLQGQLLSVLVDIANGTGKSQPKYELKHLTKKSEPN